MKYLIKRRYIPLIFAFDTIGNIIFIRTKYRKNPEKINKVLFIRLEHVGDMIMATPVFETFKRNYPHCKLHVLCRSLTSSLIKNSPYVDKVFEYDAPWFMARSIDKKEDITTVLDKLKKENYDIVFEMHGDPRSNYLAYRIGSYSIGYACRGGGFFLNKIIDYSEKQQKIEQNLKLIEGLCKTKTRKMSICTEKKYIQDALNLMKTNKLQAKKFIIINPRSGRPEKNLSDKEVISLIESHKSEKVVITGSKDEIKGNSVFSQFQNVVNLTGRTDLLVLVELVKRSRKVIAPDTGIVHIAKAVGTDFHVVYKTTDRKVWGYS